jgi:hypothetical protein
MQRRHKIALAAVILNILLFGSIVLVFSYFAETRLPKTRAQFLSREDVFFYKKYSDQLNHLRDFDFLNKLHPGNRRTHIDYLFSTVGKGNVEVLIQGDSWAEQFITNSPSFFTLQNFAEDRGFKVAVSGTTSYSPSLMQAQYRVLRQDFGFNPKIVVGVIDQTDLGDELCRYREQLALSQSGELIVKPYTGAVIVPYHLGSYFQAIDILDSAESALLRLLKYKIANLIPAQQGGCWQEILSPLTGLLRPEDRNYFIDRVAKYIEEVFKPLGTTDHPTQLILVTHFHKKHVSREYQLSVATLVQAAIEISKYRDRIVHLDFSPEDYSGENIDKIFIEGDPFSHLTDYYHRKVLTRGILNQIKIALSDSRAGAAERK